MPSYLLSRPLGSDFLGVIIPLSNLPVEGWELDIDDVSEELVRVCPSLLIKNF
jgi:hypothetical protein